MSNDKDTIPFAYGWWSWNLGTIRPGAGTYDLFSYDELPPIPKPDPKLRFLPPDPRAKTKPMPDWLREEQQKLSDLLREAQGLGLTIPDSFLTFMGGKRYTGEDDLGCGCWFSLSNRLIRCPGFDNGYLIGFLRDQQDCLVWCLCFTPDGAYKVLAVPGDVVEYALPGKDYDALLGNTEDDEDWYDDKELDDNARDIVEHVEKHIVICADAFESFIYRFWIESEILVKIGPFGDPPRVPLTEAEQRYLDHYIELDRLELERLERGDFYTPRVPKKSARK